MFKISPRVVLAFNWKKEILAKVYKRENLIEVKLDAKLYLNTF